MSIDCIENLKVGDVVCWDSELVVQTGMIDYIGSETIVVREKNSNWEILVHKSSLIDEDGQPLPKKISQPSHAQALIDLEKEFADVAEDSLIGEIRQIKKLAQNIANNLNIMKNKC